MDMSTLLIHSVVANSGGEAVYYYINDHLGTPQKVVDETGSIVWAGDYKPFGVVNETVNSFGNRFRFAGQYHDDESSHHYNYHRYYDPRIGRYLKADKLGIGGRFNHLYVYAKNHLIIYIDSAGLKCELALKLPVDVNYNSDTNWNDLGKFKAS